MSKKEAPTVDMLAYEKKWQEKGSIFNNKVISAKSLPAERLQCAFTGVPEITRQKNRFTEIC